MEYKNFEELQNKLLKHENKTIVVAAAHDKHTLEALFDAMEVIPLDYILVGDEKKIHEIATSLGKELSEDRVFNSLSDEESAFKAVEYIRNGMGDVLMKGMLQTSTLLKAIANKETGIGKGTVMSHISVIESPDYHKLLFITDGGMCPHPDLIQKEEITRNAVSFLHGLGYSKPYVAALCAAETVNEKIPETVHAKQLEELSEKGEFGSCVLEGPLSFDIAISKESATIKGVESEVSGNVDILVCDCITTGNVLSKGLTYLGKAHMAGCVVGAKVPIVLVSRGASAEEKRLSIMISLAVNA